MFTPSFGPIVAGVTALLLGEVVVGRALAEAAPKPVRPDQIDERHWELMLRSTGGWWIGALEQVFFVGALWVGSGELVVAWFGFKVASKWEAWKNVVQVPAELKPLPEAEWLAHRSALGSYILTRLWVGTLGNLVAAMVALYVGRHVAV